MGELQYRRAFQEILAGYQPSEAAKKLVAVIKLVLLVAPTSTGRNTVIHELLKTDHYHYIVSDTTRKPRVNNGMLEQSGQEYWFRDEAAVLRDLRAGEFLEAALIHQQQVSGISIRELRKAQKNNKIAITDIEIVGVESILKVKPDTTVIFMVPPSFEAWMQRLHGRGAMGHEELRRRLESACQEFRTALEHPRYTFVINDKLPRTVELIHQIANGIPGDPSFQVRARVLVRELYSQTREFLQHIIPH